MTSGEQVVSVLNRAECFYLRHISEPTENSLRLVVEEARVNRSKLGGGSASRNQFSEILKDASPIEVMEGCRTFELSWDRYIAYLVTEELVGSAGDHGDEVYTGNLFRIYSKSHFLDHLGRDTRGHIGPLTHYKLICLNHLIDVASCSPPEIRLLGRKSDEAGKVRIN